MKKFRVKCTWVVTNEIDVEARDGSEALEKAWTEGESEFSNLLTVERDRADCDEIEEEYEHPEDR